MKSTLGSNGDADGVTDDLLDAFEASLVNLEDTEDGGRQISLKRHILTVKSASGRCEQQSLLSRCSLTCHTSSQVFSVTFDALLVGHEAGVTSLSWRPEPTPTNTPTLL